MGRRLRVLWRLREPERAPGGRRRRRAGAAAAARPARDDVEPIVVTTGRAASIPTSSSPSSCSSATAARTWSSTAARSPAAARSSTCSRRPPTRRSASTCGATRSTGSPSSASTTSARPTTSPRSLIFPARELMPTDEVRARAAALVGAEPWGREQWERLAEGLVFDGMESWLPWLVDRRAHCSPTSCRRRAGRARRAAPHARPRQRPARRGGRPRRGAGHHVGRATPAPTFPRLHADIRPTCSPTRRPALDRSLPTPEPPDIADRRRRAGGARSSATARASAGASPSCSPSVTASSSPPTATARPRRLHELLLSVGLDLAIDVNGDTDLTTPGRLHRRRSARTAAASLPGAEARGRRRGRPHRPPPRPPPAATAQARRAPAFFEDLKPGNYVVHYQHGVGRYEGMVKRTIGGVERDYLLLAYKGGDKLYVPERPDRRAAPVRRRRGARAAPPRRQRLRQGRRRGCAVGGARDRPGARRALPEAGQRRPGHAFGRDTPWQHEMEEAFPYVETPDQRKAIDDVKADMERAVPDGPPACAATSASARPRSRSAPRSRRSRTASRSAVLAPTTLLAHAARQHVRRPLRRLPDPRRGALAASSPPRQAKQVIDGLASGEVDCVIGTHRLLPRTCSSRTSACSSSTRSSASACRHKEAMKKLKTDVDVLTLTATPIPRTLEMSLVGIRDLSLLQTPPADRQPILTYVGEYDERVAVEAIRRELLREGQVFWVHNRVQDIDDGRRRAPRAGARGAHRRRPRPDGRGLARADRRRLLGGPVRRARVHHDHRERHRHADGQHARRRARRPARPRPDAPAARPGRPQRASGPTPTCSIPPDRVLTEEAYERLRTIGEATELGSGLQDRDARPRDPRRRQPARRDRRAATSPPSATTSTARWSPRRSPR